MEQDTLQRRSANTIKNMGVNCYSQIVSAFRAQGDLTEEKLTILPVLQNVLGISRERHTAEVKRALYDEQLSEIASSINPSSDTTNWEAEANCVSSTIVHHPPNTKYIQLAEQLLQTVPPTTIIQYPQSTTTTKLNHDLQRLVRHEMKDDGVLNATQQQFNQTTKQHTNSFNTTDISGSKVVRLVRAKQATKRKSSLDTLIEVVQKELLRANGQNNCIVSPPPRYAPTRSLPSSKLQNRISQSVSTPHRSIISSVLPSSHPASLTSQATHSFKVTRKSEMINFNNPKKIFSLQQRNKSFHDEDDEHRSVMEYDDAETSTDDVPAGPENIEEIVRDTVDKLVATTLLNNAPFIVNMLTPSPDNGNDTESKISGSSLPINSTSLRTLSLSSTANDMRNSMHQISPNKLQSSSSQQQQQQIHHPQLIIQPATTTPMATMQGTNTSTLFVAPRILNFQTVVPKPTTNIQIGNTKIILVSPSNITHHLPHSTTPIPTTSTSTSQQQQSNFAGNSPVKLVKFTTTNNNGSMPTRVTASSLNSTQTSTLTLPKNVQIVIPSQTSSTMQLNRTLSDDFSKSLPSTIAASTTTTFRPMALTTCVADQIPQAAQEVTISTSPTTSPSVTANTTDLQQSTTLAPSIDIASPIPNIPQQLLSTTARTSPVQEEMIKSVAVNFPHQQIPRPSSTHGPMIYRMTSVNPNVPVFRVRAATAPTSTPVMHKSIKTDTKPISVTTATNVCYESKAPLPTTTNGSVSVLACFKTTKKRNKERAIMPRPSATDSNDVSQELQQRLNTIGTAGHLPLTPNISTSLIVNGDITNNTSSPDYRQQFSLTPTRLVQQTSLSSTYSDDTPSNTLSLSVHDATNDTTTSSSSSIPIFRFQTTESNSLSRPTSPPMSPIPSSFQSPPGLLMDDKSTQDIAEEASVKLDGTEQMMTNSETKKRSRDDSDTENWTNAINDLLRDILSQPDFDSLDANTQRTLTSEFDLLQSDLLNDEVSSQDDCYRSVLELKQTLLTQGLSKTCEDHLHQLFHHFEIEFSNICKRINEQKRAKRE